MIEIIKDYPSLIKDKPLTEKQKLKLINLNKLLSVKINSLNEDFFKIIDENFWDLI